MTADTFEETTKILREFVNGIQYGKRDGAYDFNVGRWLDLYLETKNPVYAWLVIRGARWQKAPIPEEVLKYLEEVASQINRILHNPPDAKQAPVVLAKALGMNKKSRGQGSVFSSFKSDLRKREIAVDTFYTVKRWGEDNKDYAFEEVGKKHTLHKSTVRRYYQSHLTTWQKKAATMKSAGKLKYDTKNKPTILVEGNYVDLQEVAILLQLL